MAFAKSSLVGLCDPAIEYKTDAHHKFCAEHALELNDGAGNVVDGATRFSGTSIFEC